MRSVNGMLTIIIVGVVMALGVPNSNSMVDASASTRMNPAKPAIVHQAPLVSVSQPLDDSCLRVPVAHPLTK